MKGLGPLPTTRDDAPPCGECILPICDPSTSGVEVAVGNLFETTMRASGDMDSHESKLSLLSFARSEMYRNLCHLNTNRVEAMERLRALL